MVQDTLEPEYFSCHEMDTTEANRIDGNTAPQLSERTPTVLVSIPSCSPWYQAWATTMSTRNEETMQSREHKRLKLEQTTTLMTPAPSDDGVCMVLANFLTDQYPSEPMTQSLKLNQIVEILGVLEPDDDKDDSAPNDPNDPNGNDVQAMATDAPMQAEFASELCNGDTDCMWNDNDAPSSALLPKHVPRVHVLWYKIVSLDDWFMNSDQQLAAAVGGSGHAAALLWREVLLAATSPKEEASLSLGIRDQTTVVANAIWMLLQSMAERNGEHGTMVQTPQETSLGCAALSIILPPVVSPLLSTNSTAAMPSCLDRWIQILRAVTPVVQVLDVTLETLDTDQLAAPSRHPDRRLRQTALQLPAGSIVLLDIRKVPSHSLSPAYLSPRQWANWQTIVQLCRQHRIHYTFEGGVRIPFEADYRIIVLSTVQNAHLLPCALTVQWDTEQDAATTTPLEFDHSTDVDKSKLCAIRGYLSRCLSQTFNVALSPDLLEHAQADFLQRRAANREQVGAAAFHRWLTLTRLQARSRCSRTADLADWIAALALDDAMQSTISSATNSKLLAAQT
jgi:Mini-chromosome maintenance replisome factor